MEKQKSIDTSMDEQPLLNLRETEVKAILRADPLISLNRLVKKLRSKGLPVSRASLSVEYQKHRRNLPGSV